jgi:eukaryotic-like serine/threonine-protein kinase
VTLAQIGRFQVERALGSGSYATVWLARDEDLDAWVAIKLLAENWSMNDDARRRFIEEARALRRLDSDRIVRVYEVGHLTDGRPYMVMEFADHGTLEDRLRLRGQLDQPFSVREAVGLSLEIAECLIAVHDLRIVHRDVKPSNVLFRSVAPERQEALRRDGKPVATERTLLGDFGIARRLEGGPHTMVLGSPQYMAPEQADPARAATADSRSDVYSAAVILYETLTGRAPFAIESPQEINRSDNEAPRIESLRRDVPPLLADVVARGLHWDPSARFSSSWEWREALRASLAGCPDTLKAAAAPQDAAASEGRLIDLRPGHAAPEVDTVPVPVGEVSTASVATMKRTAALPEVEPAVAGPPPRPLGQFPSAPDEVSTVNVRVPGGFICAAGVAMLVSIFLPWGAVGSSTDSHVGAEFRSGALVAIGAVLLFLVGLRLWRTRRRWAASLLAVGAALVGFAGIGLASYELIRLGDPSSAHGLFLLLGASLVTAFAGYRAHNRLAMAKRRERYPLLRTP